MKSTHVFQDSLRPLERSSFFLSVSGQTPQLVSFDGTMSIPMNSLDPIGLTRAKNLAHNQYVHAMMIQSDDVDVHRATLNFLCKAIERVGNPTVRPHAPRPSKAPSRKSKSAQSESTKMTAKTAKVLKKNQAA